MADPQQLRLLTEGGIRTWNRWHHRNSHLRPDFRFAQLPNVHLSAAQLPRADLHGANLNGAFLCQTNLRHADLSFADLRHTNLVHADLSHANLSGADLSGAKLSYTNLNQTIFKETILTKTNLHYALLGGTIFANSNLSTVIGLETVYLLAPCSIGSDTISLSRNTLPQRFLRNAGIHENLLNSISEHEKATFDYATTFISYAGEDHGFALQLYNDLTEAGVWCWFAPTTLKAGEYWKARIDQGIKQCQRMLVILSPDALESEWVRYEVEVARQKERKHVTPIIIPLLLNPGISKDLDWAAFLRKNRYMPPFKNWSNPRRYQEELAKLLDILKIET